MSLSLWHKQEYLVLVDDTGHCLILGLIGVPSDVGDVLLVDERFIRGVTLMV